MKKRYKKPGETDGVVLREIPLTCKDEVAAVEFLEKQRWGDKPACPYCGAIRVRKMTDGNGGRNRRFLWRCPNCRKQFTVRIGTVFEDSRIPLRIWCHAFWRACASKKGVSALQISRECHISYKSALFLMHRIRYAMAKPKPDEKLRGVVAADETWVGGKPRPRISQRKRKPWANKRPVMAIIERQGKIRVRHIRRVAAKNLHKVINETVDKDAARLCTDELKSYRRIGREFAGGHGRVNHSALQYTTGADHVNTCESFFALFKRGLYGTFHSVSKKHLYRYCSEFEFPWDTRGLNDGERTAAAIKKADGKRLVYREPTQKTA